jgi:hypothetical protein
MKKDLGEKEKEKFIIEKENEFLEQKAQELNKDVNEQIQKIQEELRSKNKNIGEFQIISNPRQYFN